MKFRCADCNEEHDLEDLSFGVDAPDPWHAITDEERAGSLLSRDQCVIRTDEETSYFVAAVLDIPVLGAAHTFGFTVWVSLSQRSFDTMHDHWNDAGRERLGPFFGWLCTSIPTYPETQLLKSMVYMRAPGLRPTIQLEPTDHPLAVHQREGIPAGELTEKVRALLHPGD